MAMPYTQADLLHLLQIDHNHFTTVVTRLSDEEQQRPFTEEGWSVKDFLNHMAHWNNATNQLLIAYLHDQPLPAAIPSGDEANAEQRQLDTIRSLQEARAHWEEVHALLQRLVQDELDDARLIERIRVPWDDEDTDSIGSIVAEMYGHDREHFDLIKSELLDRRSSQR